MGNIMIIAEAGVNHNGSVKIAKELIDASADAHADAVKFQTFNPNALVTSTTPKAGYQKKTTHANETQLEMIRKLRLTKEMHVELIQYAKTRKIQFISTPFDHESVNMLRSLGLHTWKIPSGEITNLPHLREIGALKESVLLSTGMADIQEITNALAALINSGTPRNKITLLHCHTEYPTPLVDANLKAITTMKNQFPDMSIGYSDHTQGIETAVAAAALGATVIEKHFTLDRNLPGPDHRASLEPACLKQMIRFIRNIESAMGSGIKQPSESEIKNRATVRKSIVSSRRIKEGEAFSTENLTTKRPGTGISPMLWDTILRNKATKDYDADELIEHSD